MRTRTSRTGIVLAVVFGAVLDVFPASATIDLGGKWRVEYGSWNRVEYVDVTDAGGAVSTTLTPPLGYTFQFAGTFNEPSLSLSGSLSGPASGTLDAAVFPDGDHFDGDIVIPAGGFGTFEYRILGSRCECFDGNTTAGDGCDPNCRVEPCFTCTAPPSTCTPSADGAACEDGSACTAGETCSGGACGNGTAVVPCTDMSGLWDTSASWELVPPLVPPTSDHQIVRVEQRGTTVLFRDAANGKAGFFGTIVPASGAFDLSGGPVFGWRLDGGPLGLIYVVSCTGIATLSGSVAPDGETFAGSGTIFRGCLGGPVTETGARRRCGDGTLDASEQCDDGNVVSGDGCDVNCTPTACGNGIVTSPEGCDDGNTLSGDGCSATCLPEYCGNGRLDPGEECDDGNHISGDGCDANCLQPGCGNGRLDPGEGCDDGNTVSGDGCSATCLTEGCPNGRLDPGEDCDDGNTVSGDGCDVGCTATACGNGVVTDGEECDDGNAAGGDGCGSTCLVEPCWSCDAGSPSACAVSVAPVCASPIDPHDVKLRMTNSGNVTRAQIVVRFLRNTEMSSADLGNPLAITSWDVCLLDRRGAAPGLLFAARVPAGGLCGSRPCWHMVRDGFAYKNTATTPDGIKTLKVISGTAGEAGVALQGKGPLLLARPGALPAFPVPLPLTVQVRAAGGAAGCYGANFAVEGVSENDAANGHFRATATP